MSHPFSGPPYRVISTYYSIKFPFSHSHNEKDRQCKYKRNTEECSHNHYCRGKSVSVMYSECVFVVLVIQRAQRMRCIIVNCGPYGHTKYVVRSSSKISKKAFAAAMQSWRERCEKCVCLQGDYVEK